MTLKIIYGDQTTLSNSILHGDLSTAEKNIVFLLKSGRLTLMEKNFKSYLKSNERRVEFSASIIDQLLRWVGADEHMILNHVMAEKDSSFDPEISKYFSLIHKAYSGLGKIKASPEQAESVRMMVMTKFKNVKQEVLSTWSEKETLYQLSKRTAEMYFLYEFYEDALKYFHESISIDAKESFEAKIVFCESYMKMDAVGKLIRHNDQKAAAAPYRITESVYFQYIVKNAISNTDKAIIYCLKNRFLSYVTMFISNYALKREKYDITAASLLVLAEIASIPCHEEIQKAFESKNFDSNTINFLNKFVYSFKLGTLKKDDKGSDKSAYLEGKNILRFSRKANLGENQKIFRISEGIASKKEKKLPADPSSTVIFITDIHYVLTIRNASLIDNLEIDSVIKDKQVKGLSISDSFKDEELPRSLLSFGNLSTLLLRGMQVQHIEQLIEQYKTITKLSISDRGLTKLPQAISNLEDLAHLSVVGHSVRVLPGFISSLKSLTYLSFNNGCLTEIEDEFWNTTSLVRVNFGYNKLTSISDKIGQLVELKNFQIEYNEIEVIPEGFYNLRSLKTAVLTGNKFKEISPLIGNLLQLRTLSIRKLPLKELPIEIALLENLTAFKIENKTIDGLEVSDAVKRVLKAKNTFEA